MNNTRASVNQVIGETPEMNGRLAKKARKRTPGGSAFEGQPYHPNDAKTIAYNRRTRCSGKLYRLGTCIRAMGPSAQLQAVRTGQLLDTTCHGSVTREERRGPRRRCGRQSADSPPRRARWARGSRQA